MALEALHSVLPAISWESDHRVRHIIPDLVSSLWSYLSPSRPEYNVEAARCVLRLQKVSPERELVESSITTLMIRCETEVRRRELNIEAGRRFTTLLTHGMLTSNESPGYRSSLLYAISNQEMEAGKVGNLFLLSRPLLLLTDSLFDPKTEIFVFVNNWISSLPNLQM